MQRPGCRLQAHPGRLPVPPHSSCPPRFCPCASSPGIPAGLGASTAAASWPVWQAVQQAACVRLPSGAVAWMSGCSVGRSACCARGRGPGQPAGGLWPQGWKPALWTVRGSLASFWEHCTDDWGPLLAPPAVLAGVAGLVGSPIGEAAHSLVAPSTVSGVEGCGHLLVRSDALEPLKIWGP